jgi:hypothetical protein
VTPKSTGEEQANTGGCLVGAGNVLCVVVYCDPTQGRLGSLPSEIRSHMGGVGRCNTTTPVTCLLQIAGTILGPITGTREMWSSLPSGVGRFKHCPTKTPYRHSVILDIIVRYRRLETLLCYNATGPGYRLRHCSLTLCGSAGLAATVTKSWLPVTPPVVNQFTTQTIHSHNTYGTSTVALLSSQNGAL